MSVSEPVITLDIDWAPDFVIDWTAGCLVQAGVKATWFVTHASPAVDRLRRHGDLFELGIHPNFMQGSSHGAGYETVLQHCMDLVPDARSMRTHGLVQSTAILEAILHYTPIVSDVSIFLPHASSVSPCEYWWKGKCLTRIPYVWEDDFEMMRPKPVWRFESLVGGKQGIVILAFHPIHLYLNHCTMSEYEELKRRCKELSGVRQEQVQDLTASGEGPRSMFQKVVEILRPSGGQCVRDLNREGKRCSSYSL